MWKLQGRVIVKDMLPANPNAPTSSLACDRRPARAPVRFLEFGFRVRFRVGVRFMVKMIRFRHQISEGRASSAPFVTYFGPQCT